MLCSDSAWLPPGFHLATTLARRPGLYNGLKPADRRCRHSALCSNSVGHGGHRRQNTGQRGPLSAVLGFNSWTQAATQACN